MAIEFTRKDFDDTADLAELSVKIDQIDSDFAVRITDEMMAQQPFLLSAILGFKDDVSPEEHGEIMKIYFLFWEYFKHNQKVNKRRVTRKMYEKSEKTILQMLRYSEGEPTDDEKTKLFTGDLQRMQSKALWAAILHRFNNNSVLQKMNMKIKGITLIGVRCFIDCFEKISKI